jgi:hypothetical protein
MSLQLSLGDLILTTETTGTCDLLSLSLSVCLSLSLTLSLDLTPLSLSRLISPSSYNGNAYEAKIAFFDLGDSASAKNDKVPRRCSAFPSSLSSHSLCRP